MTTDKIKDGIATGNNSWNGSMCIAKVLYVKLEQILISVLELMLILISIKSYRINKLLTCKV